ncbi:phage tail protein [Providencia rettgeri]|nr:phage tail protein [Providencia rettgeri]
MKYFALLTKLGENLLAQATALGTKLELTHMAVGDGGGSLPTPDTNQTKLIAEKRRAAINTLFIDDKNKNQIIAEQIIPEQDGGWWIREIGLFDKAGNLIAVANCPETYKPQLAEGSGRTQSIRMVLIVSHTESVTLKIDPSVVLATREYVNTEITVIDKKIDALSAQTKLDLNKKFDKANISGQKGNDNDKVPSLNLFTTEIGKLAVIGYSYSKIESDGRYQPKGNYAPAGDYATNTALNNGLNQKFDKTSVVQSTGTSTTLVMSQDASTKAFLQTGAYGLGAHAQGKQPPTNLNADLMDVTGFSGGPGAGGNNWFYNFGPMLTMIRQGGNDKTGSVTQIQCNSIELGFRTRIESIWSDWVTTYTNKNTIIDRNGNLKLSRYPDEISDFPVGSPIPWPQSTAPSGFLVCNGQSFNKSTYPLLAKAYPSGVLPDLRSEFIRGLDAGRGIDAGRVILSSQLDQMQRITGQTLIGAVYDDRSFISGAFSFKGEVTNPHYPTTARQEGSGKVYFDSGTSPSARVSKDNTGETRPRNIAFLYIVRAA